VCDDVSIELVDYPVSYCVQRLEKRGLFDNNQITVRVSKETRCYFKLKDGGISIAFRRFSDGNEAIRSEEMVVPAGK